MDYGKEFGLESIKYFCEYDLVWKIEEWVTVSGFTDYKISDLGRLKSFKCNKEKVLACTISNTGYKTSFLSNDNVKKNWQIHQLVAVAFLNHTPCGYKLVINHKNFIKTDNRKLNLEKVTNRENSNRKHLKSASIYVGVTWAKDLGKWQARIKIKGVGVYLGTFINEIDAHNAYQNKLSELLV